MRGLKDYNILRRELSSYINDKKNGIELPKSKKFGYGNEYSFNSLLKKIYRDNKDAPVDSVKYNLDDALSNYGIKKKQLGGKPFILEKFRNPKVNKEPILYWDIDYEIIQVASDTSENAIPAFQDNLYLDLSLVTGNKTPVNIKDLNYYKDNLNLYVNHLNKILLDSSDKRITGSSDAPCVFIDEPEMQDGKWVSKLVPTDASGEEVTTFGYQPQIEDYEDQLEPFEEEIPEEEKIIPAKEKKDKKKKKKRKKKAKAKAKLLKQKERLQNLRIKELEQEEKTNVAKESMFKSRLQFIEKLESLGFTKEEIKKELDKF